MKQVIILVDGSKIYVQAKFEMLKEMFQCTDFSVELTTEEEIDMSGAVTERAFLTIIKKGG